MKKRMEGQPKRVIPAFATEAEDAEWWYKNRNIHDKQLLAAVKSGEARVLTKEKLRERIAASKKTPDQRNQTTTSRDAAHADPFTPLGRPRY